MTKAKTEQPALRTAATQLDRLDLLAKGRLDHVIGLMLWQNRHRNPTLSVNLTEADIEGLEACAGHLEIKPKVLIIRPQGAPAMPPIPASATRSAQPGKPAEGPRPFVVVQLVDHNGNSFLSIENNEVDRAKQIQAEKVREAVGLASALANRIKQAGATGDYVRSDMDEAADMLALFAKALK